MFEKVSLDTWLKSKITVSEVIVSSSSSKYCNIDIIDTEIKTITDDIEIPTEEMYNNIIIPTRSTTHSAGYDFRIPFDLTVEKGLKYTIPLGIKCDLSDVVGIDDKTHLYLALYPRSSFGFKYGFRMNNTVGIIDFDYYNNDSNEGNIIIDFTCSKDLNLKTGDKICQGIITPYYTFSDVVNNTRTGGFGSTGKK